MANHIPEPVEAERFRLYSHLHYSDGMIAEATGYSKSAIRNWRNRKSYPANYSQGAGGIPKPQLRKEYRDVKVH